MNFSLLVLYLCSLSARKISLKDFSAKTFFRQRFFRPKIFCQPKYIFLDENVFLRPHSIFLHKIIFFRQRFFLGETKYFCAKKYLLAEKIFWGKFWLEISCMTYLIKMFHLFYMKSYTDWWVWGHEILAAIFCIRVQILKYQFGRRGHTTSNRIVTHFCSK